MPIEPTGAMRPLFRSMSIASSGLSAQRRRIEVIAQNIANAETTATTSGGAYRRRTVRLEAVPLAQGVPLDGIAEVAVEPGGVRVAAVEEDASEGPLVYEPGHPDADADGYVRYPNVRLVDETVDLMEARRLYDANATVLQAVKSMLRRATEI